MALCQTSFGTTKLFIIKRCDIAWKASAAIPDDYFEPGGSKLLNPSRQELISGDVQRTINTQRPPQR